MALQSSGQIKISEIKSELGSSSNSLRALSAAAGLSVPDAISEFYGYSSVVANDYYWLGDGVNDTLRFTGHGSALFNANSTDDFSYSGWFRVDETTDQLQWLGSFSTSTPGGGNMIFIQYRNAQLQLRYRNNSAFHQKFVGVVANSSVTGITSGGWTSSNRGNTNSEAFVFLTFTYDASNRNASTGIKIYWNGQEMTSVAQANSVSSPASYAVRSAAIGDAVSSSPNNASVFKGGIDQVSVYKKVLTQAEITALYNSGTPIAGVDAGVTTNLLAEYRLENNGNNSSGVFPAMTNTGGSFINVNE